MQRPVQITFRGIGPSEAIETRIRREVEGLERFSDRITRCEVTVEAPHRRHHKGNLYAVHVDLHVPGQEIFVGREKRRNPAHEDIYVAIRDSFAAATRRLEDYERKRRREVKRHDEPTLARITMVSPYEGYGFARTLEGSDIYFHENSLNGSRLDAMEVGDEVRIVIAEEPGEKGLHASAVTPTGNRVEPSA